MTIDRKEAIDIISKINGIQSNYITQNKSSHIEYRTVEMSTAWEMLVAWIEAEVKDHEQTLLDCKDGASTSGNYSYESLAKTKALIDLRAAQVYTLHTVRDKVHVFHEKET